MAGAGRGADALPERGRSLRGGPAPRHRHRRADRWARSRGGRGHGHLRGQPRPLRRDGGRAHRRRALRHLLPPPVSRHGDGRPSGDGRADDRDGGDDRPPFGRRAASALRCARGGRAARLRRPARPAGAPVPPPGSRPAVVRGSGRAAPGGAGRDVVPARRGTRGGRGPGRRTGAGPRRATAGCRVKGGVLRGRAPSAGGRRIARPPPAHRRPGFRARCSARGGRIVTRGVGRRPAFAPQGGPRPAAGRTGPQRERACAAGPGSGVSPPSHPGWPDDVRPARGRSGGHRGRPPLGVPARRGGGPGRAPLAAVRDAWPPPPGRAGATGWFAGRRGNAGALRPPPRRCALRGARSARGRLPPRQ